MRKLINGTTLTPSIEATLETRNPARRVLSNSKESIPTNKSKTSTLESDIPGSKSLQAALKQKPRKVKNAKLDSIQVLPSEKTRKVSVHAKSPIEKAAASGLEIMRKLSPIAQYQY